MKKASLTLYHCPLVRIWKKNLEKGETLNKNDEQSCEKEKVLLVPDIHNLVTLREVLFRNFLSTKLTTSTLTFEV